MTDLNKELNEYLNKNEKQFKIDVPLMPIPKPNLFGRKWFGQDLDEVKEDAGWFQRMQGNCCPNLVITLLQLYPTSILTLRFIHEKRADILSILTDAGNKIQIHYRVYSSRSIVFHSENDILFQRI